jgi:hypothetical protein
VCFVLRTVTPSTPLYQITNMVSSGYSGGTNCPNTSSVYCTIGPFPAIGTGQILAAMMGDHLDSGSGTQRTFVSVADCTAAQLVTSGGIQICGTSINTWVLPGAPCRAFAIASNGLATESDESGYALNSTAGATYITFQRSGFSMNERWTPEFVAVQPNGSAVFDQCTTANQPTASTTHTLVTASLSSTNEAVFQTINTTGSPQIITYANAGAYYSQVTGYQHEMYMVGLSLTSGGAPTFVGTESQAAAGVAMAFYVSGSPGTALNGLQLKGVVVQ